MKRHPADVTADRLIAAQERYYEHFSPSERDAIGTAIQALREVPAAEDSVREQQP
jgi:hypothetical protein